MTIPTSSILRTRPWWLLAAAAFGGSLLVIVAVNRWGVPADEHAYCRRVTALWCAFLVANAGVIVWLALAGTRELWALYTGVVAYLLMGALFAAEFVYRHWRFRRYVGLPTDALLRRFFPPDAAR